MIHIGTSGWSYDHWIGRFYPPGMAKSKWLGFYTNYFKTVELNMTFYRSPSLKTISRWIEKTPEDFRFSYKASRLITHEKRLNVPESCLRNQQELLNAFDGKAYCVLYQLPPSFLCDRANMRLLDSFLNNLNRGHHSVVEFRHPSWWNDDARRILRDRAVFCSVVGLGMPLHLELEGPVVYIRLHGNRYGGSYEDRWLERLSERIRPIKEDREIYIYFNNDIDCCAVENGKALQKILR